jgi:uncharacterized damage-inducible protein DinB
MALVRPLDKLFQYKAWANDELVAAMRQLRDDVHGAYRKRAVLILDHTYVVDRIFAAHLQNLPHPYTGLVSPETPSLEKLSEEIRASDRWYMEYATRLSGNEHAEIVDFAFTDGAAGRMSREEILTHVAMHGAYHRGAIGLILARLSLVPPKDIFTRFLHEAEPAERRR